MTSIVDAGPLVTTAENSSPEAMRIRATMLAERGPLIVPATVTAEVDYLLSKLDTGRSQAAFVRDFAEGRLQAECLERAEYAIVLQLGERYRDLRPGLADLSIVVLAHRFRTHRIITSDQRHFRAMTAIDGNPFTLLPWDEA